MLGILFAGIVFGAIIAWLGYDAGHHAGYMKALNDVVKEEGRR